MTSVLATARSTNGGSVHDDTRLTAAVLRFRIASEPAAQPSGGAPVSAELGSRARLAPRGVGGRAVWLYRACDVAIACLEPQFLVYLEELNWHVELRHVPRYLCDHRVWRAHCAGRPRATE